MVDISQGLTPELVTSEAPRSPGVGGAFARQPERDISGGLAALGEGVDAVAVRAAQEQAASDLQKRVTLDANGMPATNDNPFTIAPILGKAGEAYTHATETGLIATLDNRQRMDLADLRQVNSDPQEFRTAADAYLQKQASAFTGPVGQAIYQQGAKIAAMHYGNAVNERAQQNLANDRQATLTQITDGETRLQQMALNGQSGQPEFIQEQKNTDAARARLVANPAFGYSAEKAKSDAADTAWRVHASDVQSRIQSDRDSKRRSYDEIDSELRALRDDPTSPLGRAENDRLYLAGKARLDFTTQQQQSQAADVRTTTDAYLKSFADPNSPKPTKDQIDTLGQKAFVVGAPDAGYRLQSMSASYGTLSLMTGMTPVQKAQALIGNAYGGGATFDPNNTDRYLNTTKSIENPTGNPRAVSPTGASGDFQFTRGTAAQYGVVDPTDPTQARDGAKRLAIDNAASLTKSLGRAPTEGEVYLAHQQGAAGAAALLQNPNMPAVQALSQAYGGDLAKADQAIRVNGGNPSMTAGQFAAKWTNRFGGPPSSPGGIPFTPQQIADNPLIASTYLARVRGDDGRNVALAKLAGQSILHALDGGFAPSQTELAAWRQSAQSYPTDLGDLSRKVESTASAFEKARGVAPDEAGGAQMIAQADALASSSPSIAHAEDAAILRKMITDEHARYVADPIGWMRRNGYDKTPEPTRPINMADAGSVAGEFAARAKSISNAPPNVGQNISLLRPGEPDIIKQALASGTAGEKLGILNGIVNSGAPASSIQKTLGDLAKDSETKVFALAGKIASESPATAQAIVTGQTLLKMNGKYGPDGKEAAPALQKAFTQQDFPGTESRALYQQGVTAMYAKLSADANDVTGKLNQERFDQAVQAVTGGTINFRGSRVIAPWRGADDGTFRTALQAITPADMQGAMLADGTAFPATALQSPTMIGTSGNWRLQSVGDGRYAVFSGDDTSRSYVLDQRSGLPFQIDLGAKKVQVEGQPRMPEPRLPPPTLAPIRMPGDMPSTTKGPLPVSVEMGS